eukprot:jgi/Mesen1/2683/ME000167S01834
MSLPAPKLPKLFTDLLSQPARAVVLFCDDNEIEYELEPMELNKGDTRKPDFLAENPFGKVPALDDNGFKLSESHAILRYLTNARMPENEFLFFPYDAKKRAQVDMLLDWHHLNLRRGVSGYCFGTTIGPVHFGLPVNTAYAEQSKPVMLNAFRILNDFLLTRPIAGPLLMGKHMCLADYSLACEISQLQVLGDEERSELLKPYPRITNWLEAVKEATAPHWDKVHSKLQEVSSKADIWRQSRS